MRLARTAAITLAAAGLLLGGLVGSTPLLLVGLVGAILTAALVG